MFSKYKKRFFFIAGTGVLFVVGLIFGLRSWNQNLYVSWSPPSERGLAEDSQDEVLVNISQEEMIGRADEALFENVRLIEDENLLTFYLGNILVPDEATGQYRFLCDIYSYIEFSFAPIGIKLSGDPGAMILQSPCRQEEFELGPFFIPRKEILNSPEKRSFEFEEIESYLSFYKSSVVLTPSWILKTVRLFNGEQATNNQEDNEEFIIRYNPKNNEPFEVILKKAEDYPELILKERSL